MVAARAIRMAPMFRLSLIRCIPPTRVGSRVVTTGSRHHIITTDEGAPAATLAVPFLDRCRALHPLLLALMISTSRLPSLELDLTMIDRHPEALANTFRAMRSVIRVVLLLVMIAATGLAQNQSPATIQRPRQVHAADDQKP